MKVKKIITNIAKRYLLIISKKLGDFSAQKSHAIPVGFSNSARDTNYLIAIVGFGNQGKAIYSGISALPGATVKVICDIDTKKIHDAKSINKNLLCFDNLNDFKNTLTEIDLVIIATTAPSHLDILSNLLLDYKGKILVEKPLDSSLKKSIALGGILTLNDKQRIFVNYSKRHLPDLKNIKHIVKLRGIGKINSIQISIGKGELAMIASHYFDYLKYLLDKEPIKVQATLTQPEENTRGHGYEDNNGTCMLFYEDGITAAFDFSANHKRKDVQILIKCEEGYIFYDEHRGYILIAQKGMAPFVYNSLELGTTKIGIQRVLSDILSDEPSSVKCSFADAHEVVKIIYACHYSSNNNSEMVDIKDDFEKYSSITGLNYP
jgi:predicted dehydrogenase